MDMKQELGKKIRRLRTEQNISRENFCEDESQLTVRQLARIEKGESLPSLEKLDFISQRLNIRLNQLVDLEEMVLPQKYLEIKNKLLTFQTLLEEDRIKKKEELYDYIYDNYYEDLPEEEQVAIDIMHATSDVLNSSDTLYAEPIIQEYFEHIMKKKHYTFNDILTIRLYLEQITFDNIEQFDLAFISKLTAKVSYSFKFNESNFINYGTTFFITALTVFWFYESTEDIRLCIQILKEIVAISKNINDLIIILMLEAKCLLFPLGEYKQAETNYQKAIHGAQMIDDSVLEEKLKLELEKDREKYHRIEKVNS